MIKTFSVSQEPNFFVPTENILDEPMSAFPLKADIGSHRQSSNQTKQIVV